MSNQRLEETRAAWNRRADDWKIQVGRHGDSNRILNSDPVLWKFAENVDGLNVLDAGCGTGYLAEQLRARGALVTGVDLSERMIQLAQADFPAIEFRVDSCTTLATCLDEAFDLIVSNYVLMDLPDLTATSAAFHRVLRKGGAAIVVFSHPCFPQGRVTRDRHKIKYSWTFPYFKESQQVDPPWGHFTAEAPWFHRPLSDYWKAFRSAGFSIEDFEEPRVTEDRYHLAENPRKLENSKTRPYSVAFRLRK